MGEQKAAAGWKGGGVEEADFKPQVERQQTVDEVFQSNSKTEKKDALKTK